MGVDAQIEVCENGVPTGRLIALQIKTGQSWLSEQSSTGYIFRGNLTHLDYWNSHSLPLIVALCDIEEDKVWWKLITEGQIIRTNKAWKVIVPFEQRFNKAAKESLKSIATLGWEKYENLNELVQELGAVGSIDRVSKLGLLNRALKLAENSVEILTPYLDEKMYNLLTFLSCGVRVRLVLREVSPSIRKEFELYAIEHPNLDIRQHSNLHAKSVLIDELLIISSSANFTTASWRGMSPEMYISDTDRQQIKSAVYSFDKVWKRATSLSIKDRYGSS